MNPEPTYLDIVRHYETCLDVHGDTHLGVDWPNPQDAETRYRVMLELVRSPSPSRITLLDFGCGASHLYEHILRTARSDIEYSGLDLSEKFIRLCRQKFPAVQYYCVDALNETADLTLPSADYVVMNGVFTEKGPLTFEDMWSYFTRLLTRTFRLAERGLAFNVMSTNVDWQRDDLFHVPLDRLTEFLTSSLTRQFVVRSDYGLYEYTVYLYR